MAISVIVKATTPNLPERSHTLHEQQYNTGHEVSAIPNEVRREVWSKPGQPQIQQRTLVYLLLAQALGWDGGIPWLSVQKASRASQAAHGGRTQAHSRYAPPESQARAYRVVVLIEGTGIFTHCWKPIPLSAAGGAYQSTAGKEETQIKAL